ncbi:CPI1 [Symbiodinium natans]|uniref:CPI1 protein n=1 Tax=Symbiodinium natans TaxID=878477 RepID=A0A812J6N9_9DINO|nr:CPI1 [Symbiodinium natans]
MCGRGALTLSGDRCRRIAGAHGGKTSVRGCERLRTKYNLGPMNYVPVIRSVEAEGSHGGGQDASVSREVCAMRWGLVPSFAKRVEDFDAFKGGSSTFNARVEGAEGSSLWRRLLDRRRCVVLFDGFYEWKANGKTKTPMFIRNRDAYDGHTIPWSAKMGEEPKTEQPVDESKVGGPQHAPLLLAGLYDTWHQKGDAESLESVTILTMDPESTAMEQVHDRMPVFLTPEHALPALPSQDLSRLDFRKCCAPLLAYGNQAMDLPPALAPILASQFLALSGLSFLLERAPASKKEELTAKEKCENWFLAYGLFWISCFAVIIACGLYEHMGKWHYLLVTGGLAAPLALQPLFFPSLTGEKDLPLMERHCTKANVWIAIYSFLGNYWGTHYFYSVLKAKYTLPFLPDHQLNKVPVCMYLATHLYFCFYHALGSKVLRWVWTEFRPSAARTTFCVAVVCVMAYCTAFLETFSISAFPYYTFDDRQQMYTLGSAFYALYLAVSFPLFARLDWKPGGHSLTEACLEAFAAWAIILSLLDFVRLGLGADFCMMA